MAKRTDQVQLSKIDATKRSLLIVVVMVAMAAAVYLLFTKARLAEADEAEAALARQEQTVADLRAEIDQVRSRGPENIEELYSRVAAADAELAAAPPSDAVLLEEFDALFVRTGLSEAVADKVSASTAFPPGTAAEWKISGNGSLPVVLSVLEATNELPGFVTVHSVSLTGAAGEGGGFTFNASVRFWFSSTKPLVAAGTTEPGATPEDPTAAPVDPAAPTDPAAPAAPGATPEDPAAPADPGTEVLDPTAPVDPVAP